MKTVLIVINKVRMYGTKRYVSVRLEIHEWLEYHIKEETLVKTAPVINKFKEVRPKLRNARVPALCQEGKESLRKQ